MRVEFNSPLSHSNSNKLIRIDSSDVQSHVPTESHTNSYLGWTRIIAITELFRPLIYIENVASCSHLSNISYRHVVMGIKCVWTHRWPWKLSKSNDWLYIKHAQMEEEFRFNYFIFNKELKGWGAVLIIANKPEPTRSQLNGFVVSHLPDTQCRLCGCYFNPP